MPSRLELGGSPFIEIGNYARPGPGRRDHFSREQLELLDRTVRRTPEVMVKVLSQGAHDRKAVARHLRYLNRRGDLDMETDDGDRLKGEGVEKELIEEWDLDLDELRSSTRLDGRAGGRAPRLVHKLLFSMPPGTAPQRVLDAVKAFAREEFALKHRYAMVLHTDEPHPHVHLVVKAVSEDGERLNIRKATLRDWRRQFARNLRAQGVEANATGRAVRGQQTTRTKDGAYRAASRGDSRYVRARAGSMASPQSIAQEKRAMEKLAQTRALVQVGWAATIDLLRSQGHDALASASERFTRGMALPRTDADQFEKVSVESPQIKIDERSFTR